MNWRERSFTNWLRILLPSLSLILCATRLLWIVKEYSVNVLIGDQWSYNEPTLFHPQSVWAIFRWQSGPWRQGLGGLLTAAVGRLTHWNSRDESFVAAGIVIVGCVLALCLSVRVKGQISVWDSLIPLFVLSPVEYQTLVGVAHYSHGPLPFLLVIAFCLAWTIRRRYVLKYALVATIAFFCTYTGFGIFIGLICPVIISIELWRLRLAPDQSERRAAVIALVVSILSLFSFFAGFGFSDGVCPPHVFTNPEGVAVRYPNPLHYFLFLAFMFGNFVGLKAAVALVPSILGGSAILLFVLAEFFFAARKLTLQVISLILIAYSLLFALATAHGRMCLGLGAALGSRYMIYLVPSFLGIYFFAISSESSVSRSILLSILAIVALCSSLTVHQSDRDDMAEFRRRKEEWRRCYLAERNLLDCNRKVGATVYTYPDTIQTQIDYLERRHLNFYFDSQTNP